MTMTTRRDFLKCAALLGAAAVPVSYAAGQETKPAAKAAAADNPLFQESYKKRFGAEKTEPRKITIPDAGKWKVLKGDFHIHTLFSDGHVMPVDRVHEAVQNGLDVISITDHIEYRPYFSEGGRWKLDSSVSGDHNIAYNTAKPEAEKQNLLLIRGTEITKRQMPPGHFNAIFLKDVNPVADAVDDWKKMLAAVSEQGGFVTWNHPGWVAPASGGLEKGVPMSFTSEHEDVRKKGHLHGIEIFNGFNHYPAVGDWCNELDLSPVVTSDIHVTELAMYGIQNLRRPMTLILAEDRTEEAVRDAFFAHRTIGWAMDMIFGRPEAVEKLFAACVSVTKNNGTVHLVNKSDIPCRIQADGAEYELKPQGSVSFKAGGTLTVANWFIGTNKPLTV
ncbi:MAG: twin-arginine translocation signal domain-containing protein [Planctomycetaceae bacterium]|jgi:hypothetical protein|nr:twin-arginine translocation signal domain-containing protein [Planctomycetaceae bacterium]